VFSAALHAPTVDTSTRRAKGQVTKTNLNFIEFSSTLQCFDLGIDILCRVCTDSSHYGNLVATAQMDLLGGGK
jgi:hypothetical protein